MFRYLFINWHNKINTPFVNFKLNMWNYLNINYFEIKLANFISYFIVGLNNLKLKFLKISFYDFRFENFYFFFLIFFISFLFLFIIISQI